MKSDRHTRNDPAEAGPHRPPSIAPNPGNWDTRSERSGSDEDADENEDATFDS